MTQRIETFFCTNTRKHKDDVWVKMEIGQFEPERRITLGCPECGSSIAIDYNVLKGYVIMSTDEVNGPRTS
jgi:hypothetical protein